MQQSESWDWKELHAQLVGMARSKAALDEELGRLLLLAMRAQVHRELGYGSFLEYVERLFGFGPREAGERLRVAHALDELPRMAAALRLGRLCWSAARELSRVAVRTTEEQWLAAAQGKTVREIERLVSGKEPGDLPDDAPRPGAKRHVLRFEVSADTYALWRDAVALLRQEAGGELDEDAAFLMMARRTLGGPDDAGRASYQVAMNVCPSCREGHQQGRGEAVAIGDEVVEMALCDAQHIGDTHVGVPRRASQSIPPATRRSVMHRDGGRCVVPGCRCAVFLDVHHLKMRSEGGNHDPEWLVLLCGTHHKAAHRGLLVIGGSVSRGLSFFHADGTRYGAAPPDPAAIDMSARAYAALRGLGFKETESKQALAAARTHMGNEPSIEALVRAAIGVLTPSIACW